MENRSLQQEVIPGYLSKFIHNYIDLDDTTSLVLLKFNDQGHPIHQTSSSNYTSRFLSNFLNTTRSGSAHKHAGISLKTFLSSILVSVLYCCFQAMLFGILRKKIKVIYQPNSYTKSRKNQESKKEYPLAEIIEGGMFGWIKPIWKTPTEEYKQIGMDAFFFLRFLKVLGIFFLTLAVINIPILVPIHYTSGYNPDEIQEWVPGMNSSSHWRNSPIARNNISQEYSMTTSGLDKISMSNVSPNYANRFIFHLILSIFAIAWFHVVLISELEYYISERNKYIVNNWASEESYQSTIFIDNLPKKMVHSEREIRKFFDTLVPGCIEKVWFIPQTHKILTKHLEVEERITHQIESLELGIIYTRYFNKSFKSYLSPAVSSMMSEVKMGYPGLINIKGSTPISGNFENLQTPLKTTEFTNRSGMHGQNQRKLYRLVYSYPIADTHNFSQTHQQLLFERNKTFHFLGKVILNNSVHFELKDFKTTFKLGTCLLPFTLYFPIISYDMQTDLENQYQHLDMLIKRYFKNLHNWDRVRNIELTNRREPFSCVHQEITDHTTGSTKRCYNKAFIQFKNASLAHFFDQLLLSSNVKEMGNKILGVHPEDIIWENITKTNKAMIYLRVAISNFLSVIVIIGWVLPVAFIGLISQIPYLAKLIPLFSWVNNFPSILSGLVSSILPIVTLVFLTEIVPFIFRWISLLKCKRTGSEIELDVQKWFFVFLFVHIFLVVTVSSGISVIVEKIVNNPVSIPNLLGNNLPKSSNFFCSFVIIRGLSYFGGNLLQIRELFMEAFYYPLVNDTPRRKFQRAINLPIYKWGSIYPIFSVLGSIGIIYCVIAPLILPLSCIAFSLVFISFKYSLKYQFSYKNVSETLGKFYPQALMQLYAGIYCLEICLIGLFALSNCYRLSMCMIVTLSFTIIAHFQISNTYNNYLNNIPASFFLKVKNNKKIESRPENEEDDFYCPQLRKKDRVIWIPWDIAGISDEEKLHLYNKYGLKSSNKNSGLDISGKLFVAGNAPDYC